MNALTAPLPAKISAIAPEVAQTRQALRVADNGDCTLTILILATGNGVLYGENGKAMALNPGQVRFELVVDHGGTPNDRSDDVELDFRLVKESTGRERRLLRSRGGRTELT